MVGELGLCPGFTAKNPRAGFRRFTNSPITRVHVKLTCSGRAAGSGWRSWNNGDLPALQGMWCTGISSCEGLPTLQYRSDQRCSRTIQTKKYRLECGQRHSTFWTPHAENPKDTPGRGECDDRKSHLNWLYEDFWKRQAGL